MCSSASIIFFNLQAQYSQQVQVIKYPNYQGHRLVQASGESRLDCPMHSVLLSFPLLQGYADNQSWRIDYQQLLPRYSKILCLVRYKARI